MWRKFIETKKEDYNTIYNNEQNQGGFQIDNIIKGKQD